jgi:hypothetical protein
MATWRDDAGDAEGSEGMLRSLVQVSQPISSHGSWRFGKNGEYDSRMTAEERLDAFEARQIAHGIALTILASAATPATRARLGRAADRATDFGLAYELSDEQIEQIRELLKSLADAAT